MLVGGAGHVGLPPLRASNYATSGRATPTHLGQLHPHPRPLFLSLVFMPTLIVIFLIRTILIFLAGWLCPKQYLGICQDPQNLPVLPPYKIVFCTSTTLACLKAYIFTRLSLRECACVRRPNPNVT